MGKNKELTYKRWKGMKARCYAPSFNTEQNKYQSLGIIVCERWKNNYLNFKNDMGECPEGYSLERVNPLGNYELTNCKWIPVREQPKNRTNSLYFTIGDETKILKDWAKEYKVTYTTLRHRILVQGMSIIEALKYTKLIEIDGNLKSVKDWCIHYNISYTAVVSKKYEKKLQYKEAILSYIK
jgi:hypothetical protein